MKIGICRHFPVPHNRYKILTPLGFRNWINWYDHGADVKILEVDNETSKWDLCFSSDLQRAKTTAKTLYSNTIQLDKDLREVPFSVFPIVLPIPVMAWKVLARIGWLFNMKHQSESRTDSIERSLRVLKKIIEGNSDQNLLIVTHGFFMQYLNKEMLRLGFEGKIPVHPKGGTVYSFERKES
jgi:broad specificity phosphatase PhoE